MTFSNYQFLTSLTIPTNGVPGPGSSVTIIGANAGDGTLPPELVAAGYTSATLYYSDPTTFAATGISYKFDAFKTVFGNTMSREMGDYYPAGNTIHLEMTMLQQVLPGPSSNYQMNVGATNNGGGNILEVVGNQTNFTQAVMSTSGAQGLAYVSSNGINAEMVADGTSGWSTSNDPLIDTDQTQTFTPTINGAVCTMKWDWHITYDRIADVRLAMTWAGTPTAGIVNLTTGPPALIGHSTIGTNSTVTGAYTGPSLANNGFYRYATATGQLVMSAIPATLNFGLTLSMCYCIDKP